jgi:hypothetical protein
MSSNPHNGKLRSEQISHQERSKDVPVKGAARHPMSEPGPGSKKVPLWGTFLAAGRKKAGADYAALDSSFLFSVCSI